MPSKNTDPPTAVGSEPPDKALNGEKVPCVVSPLRVGKKLVGPSSRKVLFVAPPMPMVVINSDVLASLESPALVYLGAYIFTGFPLQGEA